MRTAFAARMAAVLGATALLCPAAAVAGAHTATGPITKSLNYTCEFPLIGPNKLVTKIDVTMPESVKVGQLMRATDLAATITVPEEVAQSLLLFEAETIEGTSEALLAIDANGTPIDVTLPNLVIPKTPVPKTGDLVAVARGPVPGIGVRSPGAIGVAVGDHTSKLTPRKADGSPTELGTFDLVCTQDAGQDPSLARIPVHAAT
ncbi:hypothetical protein JOF53_006669 [Crossiella equi]|uniref:DUF6801 domain-containing protein n=1 Tax=Crossiella equi TaxID=130796 RepID=A0ABS5ANI5_9PSEU|nr:DUF6801 domain-containing protein [Crossiella equi]MBP2477797.1 hypothetical protein [Crossiella equi]